MSKEEPLYNVYRFYRSTGKRKLILKGVSLEIAKLHCNDPRTASPRYGSGSKWFDGFMKVGS